jgi:hypothetical protein
MLNRMVMVSGLCDYSLLSYKDLEGIGEAQLAMHCSYNAASNAITS